MRQESQEQKDSWFLKPHASDDMELTEKYFKAFGWGLIVRRSRKDMPDTAGEGNDGSLPA